MQGTLIYEPKGRAREYAALACNIYRGCSHGCSYCWSPLILHQTREAFSDATTRGDDFLEKLTREATKHQRAGITGQVLLCFSCDPYQPLDIELALTRQTIQILHNHGFSVCILTKGGGRALRDIDLFSKEDAFATTLTFFDPKDSVAWEPNAALPIDRMNTLKIFHDAEIPTWVSLEPVINPSITLQIIRETKEYVDHYKVGMMNYHQLTKTIDWRTFANDAVDLLKSLGKSYYIKQDLYPYLTSSAKK